MYTQEDLLQGQIKVATNNSVDLWKLQQDRMNGVPDMPEYLQHADQSATEAERAYKEALSGVPAQPNPSGWRKLAAIAAGALGGYHQQFIDPRVTAAATQGILDGDYPTQYRKSQEAIKRAETGVALADRGRARATDRYRVEQDNETKKSNAQLLTERTRQVQMDRFQNTIGTRSRALTPEEVTDPTIQASVKAGTHALVTDPEGNTHLTETPAFIRSETDRQRMEMLRQQIADRAGRSADTIEAQNQRNADNNANRLLIAGMLKAGQDGGSKADKQAAAAQALLVKRESAGVWSKLNAEQGSIDAEVNKLDPAVVQGRSTDPIAQASFARLLERSKRINDEAHRQDAALQNFPSMEAYHAHNAKFRPEGGDPAKPGGGGPKTSPAPAPPGKVKVRNKDGVEGTIPRAQLEGAKVQGYTEVP